MFVNRMFFVLILIVVVLAKERLDYSDQQNWDHLCITGNLQSPINIVTQEADICPDNLQLNVNYENAKIRIQKILEQRDNMVDFSNQTIITLIEKNLNSQEQFRSLQFHWHSPSEHTVNGKQFPLELHIVHKSSQDNVRLAVISILFNVDFFGRFNFFDQINFLEPSSTSHSFPFGIKDKMVFHYKGSLTTPPCSEVVDWLVYLNPFTINQARLDEMKANINWGEANNRKIQNSAGRKVQMYGGVCRRIHQQ